MVIHLKRWKGDFSMIINYNGLEVHVNKINGDGTIIGYPYGDVNDNMHPSLFSDFELQGSKVLTVNGGIFYTYDNMQYANGIEISQGNINQLWDTSYNEVYGIGITNDFKPVFAKQKDLKNMSLRSAITGNFGIMIGGVKVSSPRYIADYYSISGRTILGHDEKDWIIISFSGVTGKTGLSGPQLYDLCVKCGCKNAICLDGGGSVYLEVDGKIIINTSRKVKNVFMIYKQKEELDMPLKLVVRKQSLVLRKELKFVLTNRVEDECPFTGVTHYTTRWLARGEILRDSARNPIEFKIGSELEVIELLPNLQLDGWQWVKVLYKGVEYYAQYDSMAYSIELM